MMSRRPHPPLVLFDIDGTLVRRAGPHHRKCLEEAAQRLSGLPMTTAHIPTQGMMDGQILSLMFAAGGLSASEGRRLLPAVMELAQSLYEAGCPDLRRRVCPGARSVLYRLAQKRIRSGLVTGNLSRIGWKKLERAGIKHYLQFGAFAELAEERKQLVQIAIDQARQEGWITARSTIVLVGDHENDILAAKANGIPVVSVATGVSTAEELALLKPEYLINDLRSFPWQELSL